MEFTILYWLFFIIMVLGFGFNKFTIRKYEKKYYDEKINFEFLVENIRKQFKKREIKNVEIQISSIYSFDNQKKVLSIKRQQNYSTYDVFVCYHEIGHIVDAYGKMKDLYKFIGYVKIMFYFMWIPTIYVNVVHMLKLDFVNFVNIINCVMFLMGGAIVAISIMFEYRASRYAILEYKYSNVFQENDFQRLTKLSLLDHVLYWWIIFFPLFFLMINSTNNVIN